MKTIDDLLNFVTNSPAPAPKSELSFWEKTSIKVPELEEETNLRRAYTVFTGRVAMDNWDKAVANLTKNLIENLTDDSKEV